ncbi:hypothetical protein TFLX_05015 [Thermoflexales bacterium]|nr:hypothetical protein TFLX_05015 [Thermoflexales bacterium]
MNKLDAWVSRLLDGVSDYVSGHRGVPVLIGVLLVLLNYLLRLLPETQLGFIESTDLLLHLGVVVGLVGILLGDALN